MTPEQVQMLTAISSILQQMGALPIGTIIIAIMFGPWIMMSLISRSIERRHEQAMEMYKNNVKLVERYEKMALEQIDTIRLSTAAMTECKDAVNNNQFCPIIRVSKKKAIRIMSEDETGGA